MRSTLTGLFFAITLFSAAHAESLSYSGRLVNSNGSPVTGTPTLRFEMASTLDTSAILCSDQISGVALSKGVFHVKIDLDCGGPSLSQKLHEISLSGKEAVLRVINVDASKTYSFQELHAVPKASLSSFSTEALQLSQNGATSGQLLAWDGAKWAPVTPGGASSVGSVTSIIAGAGLSGGTITSSGTIAVANSGVTDAHLAGNIARSKLANGTPNYVLVNDGTGAMSGLAQLSIALGGTGASTAAGARSNLGLGSAAIADIGTSAGNVMSASGVPSCLPFEKLQMSVGPTYAWTCASNSVTTTEILDGTIANADIANTTITYTKLNLTDGDIPQAKVNGLVTALSNKEPMITAGTTAQYWRGDKSWQTLDTSAVPEGSRMYFTEPRVLGSLMSGYSVGTAVPLSAADTLSQALGKLEAQITANKASVDSNGKWSKTGSDIYYNLGNVGVGTTTPQTSLHVNSATNTMLRISAGNATRDTQIEFMRGAAGSWFGPSSGGTFDLWSTENIPMIFAVNDDEKMRIAANGNVGIGTDTPAAELHIVDGTDSQAFVRIDSARAAVGASTAVIELNATASTAPANKKNFQIMNVNATTGNQLSVMATNDDGTQKGRRVTISHDGDVAIGTNTTPAAKLDVDGGVKIANDASTCDSTKQGTMRFVSGNFQGCDGTSWVTMGGSTPPGQVATYAMTSCPSGWIKANGAAVSRTTYATLYAAIGTTWGAGDGSTTFTLPDLRGEFVRGLDDGRGVDTGRAIASAQGDDNKSHTHTATTSTDGNHAHTGSTSSDGNHAHSGNTSVDGWHGHGVNALYPWDANVLTTNDWSTDALLGTDNAPGGNGFRSTNQGTEGNGNHAHNLNINAAGAHAHSFTTSTVGAHAHTLTTAASGGTETRPRNRALLYCIKI